MFKLDENVAEETGIHIGDGMMNYYPSCRSYYIKFVGDLEEMEPYGNHIIHLLRKNYGLNNLRAVAINGTNYYNISFSSKSVLSFKRNVLCLPMGRKDNVSIPKQILDSDKLFKRFMRGLFDTDGTLWFEKKKRDLHYYPKIKIELKSRKTIEQCMKKLVYLGFKVSASFNLIQSKNGKNFITHRIVISGQEGLEKWWHSIGSSNLKNITKYRVWKKFGFCPPHTKINQRQEILDKRSGIRSFYE